MAMPKSIVSTSSYLHYIMDTNKIVSNPLLFSYRTSLFQGIISRTDYFLQTSPHPWYRMMSSLFLFWRQYCCSCVSSIVLHLHVPLHLPSRYHHLTRLPLHQS